MLTIRSFTNHKWFISTDTEWIVKKMNFEGY